MNKKKLDRLKSLQRRKAEHLDGIQFALRQIERAKDKIKNIEDEVFQILESEEN